MKTRLGYKRDHQVSSGELGAVTTPEGTRAAADHRSERSGSSGGGDGAGGRDRGRDGLGRTGSRKDVHQQLKKEVNDEYVDSYETKLGVFG